MAEESDLEKTEPASSRRIEQAREEGNVPHSRELGAFLILLAGVGGLLARRRNIPARFNFDQWFSGRRAATVALHCLDIPWAP